MSTINVGMNRSHGGSLSVDDITSTLTAFAVTVHESKVVRDIPEDTFIASVSGFTRSIAFDVSVALDQDCIAVVDGTHGELIGPRVSEWGTFNPVYFKTL